MGQNGAILSKSGRVINEVDLWGSEAENQFHGRTADSRRTVVKRKTGFISGLSTVLTKRSRSRHDGVP